MTKAQGRRHNKNAGRYKDQKLKTDRNKLKRKLIREKKWGKGEEKRFIRALVRETKNKAKGIPRRKQKTNRQKGPVVFIHPGKITFNGQKLDLSNL